MKIRTKIILLVAIMLAAVVGGMMYALVTLERKQIYGQEKAQVANIMKSVERAAGESLTMRDDLMLLSYLRFQMKEYPELEICLVTKNGYTTVLGKVKTELEYHTVSAAAGVDSISVQAGFSADYVKAKLHRENMELLRVTLVVALIGLGIGLAGTIYISHRIARPIASLSAAAEKLGHGDLDAAAETRGAAEIAALARSFNSMAGSIRESVQAKEDLLSTLTHELNNPLAGLKAFIAMLRDPRRISTIQETRQAYDTMAEAVGQMELTLSNALELFRTSAKPALDPEVVDLNELAKEAVALYGPVARSAHIDLRLDAPERGLAVMADRKLIRRVIINLVSNAVKYTPERGSITVKLGEAEGRIEFSVADTGYGIGKEDQALLFTKFYRTRGADGKKTKIPGSGLGLAIVKQAVEMHGGSISLESEKGKGSTFTVSLPKSSSGELI